jgi:hypothetical protein
VPPFHSEPPRETQIASSTTQGRRLPKLSTALLPSAEGQFASPRDELIEGLLPAQARLSRTERWSLPCCATQARARPLRHRRRRKTASSSRARIGCQVNWHHHKLPIDHPEGVAASPLNHHLPTDHPERGGPSLGSSCLAVELSWFEGARSASRVSQASRAPDHEGAMSTLVPAARV